jgi:hypothetical protein
VGQARVGVGAGGACAGSGTAPVSVARGATSTADIALTGSTGYTLSVGARAMVAADGTVLALTGDDVAVHVTAPFPLRLYGQVSTDVWVDTNGVAALAGPGGPSREFGPVPSTAGPNLAAYPLWADWVVDDQASVRTATTGVVGARRFVIEWRNVLSYQDGVSRVSFEVVFFAVRVRVCCCTR